MHQQRLLLLPRRGQLLVRRQQRVLRLRRGVALHVRLEQRELRVPAIGQQVHDDRSLLLDDDDVSQQCDFSSEFSSDSDFACACARNNGDCFTTNYRGGASDGGDGRCSEGCALAIFIPLIFCITLFACIVVGRRRRRDRRNFLRREMEQQQQRYEQRGVGLVAGTGTVPRPIDGASLPPVAVPTCSVPVAVAVGAGAPPIAVPVDARSSPVAVPVGTMPVAAASYVNAPVTVVAGQPMPADSGASSSGLYGGKKI